MHKKAFAVFDVKSFDEEKGVLRGIASTPTADRASDIVDPKGAVFKLPIPLLWQHKSDQPIGQVIEAQVTDAGIEIVAIVPKGVTEEIDKALRLIKAGLVRGFSIGFRGLDVEEIPGSWGVRFKKWEWLELSAVTIPANAEATITSVKHFATEQSAATGTEAAKGKTPVGATTKSHKPVQLFPKDTKLNISEQIAALEASRSAKAAAMQAILEKAISEGRTTSVAEQDEFDGISAEVESIDADLKRFRALEKAQVGNAKPIPVNGIKSLNDGAAVRLGAPVVIKGDKDEAFEGQNYTRMVIAKTLARLDDVSAVGIAHKRWGQHNPQLVESVKAAVSGGGTESGEWGAELVHIDRYTGDFIEYLYSRTVFDKLPLREVPANVNISGQDGAATGYWVGQSKSIPVSKADFMDVNLKPLKVAALAVVSKELLRDSSPSAERLVRDALVEASAQRVDQTFLGAGAAVTNVSPAGILNGVTPIASAGNDIEGVIADVKALYASFIAAHNADGLQYISTQSLAKSLGLMQNVMGNFAFPGLSANGGTLLGDTLVAGGNVTAGSLILLKPSDIYKIGDRGVEVSLSTEAAIQMDDAPDGESDTPTPNSNVVSMFQTESVAIKVVRPLNFAKRRASAVAAISGADYGTPAAAPAG